MGLLNIIRRMHLRQKLSIREIARLTGVSRNTVTKHLAANTIEPKFATPERSSKIDPFAGKLSGWLKTEAGKSRKQRRTMKQLHADLAALGFTGSYARVAAFSRKWKADRQREQQTTGRGTFVPLHFDPGDAFQFDWSARSCRWRISSCRTAALFCCAPIRCKPTRCCSMPTGTASGCLAASLVGGFTIT
jgi:transposase